LSERIAIIVGHKGQDGRLLNSLLQGRGYSVIGIGRSRVETFGPIDSVPPCSLSEPETLATLVRRTQPNEIYYLAAHHGSSESQHRNPLREWQSLHAVNVDGLLSFLESIRLYAQSCRLFYASSSLIYGSHPAASPQTEDTPCNPDEPYGASKAYAADICRDYRRHLGVFASVGILYNHESHLRRGDFLSMKLARGAIAASRGDNAHVAVGSLDATVDWGYAPDFVDAFTRILQVDYPTDFVVATGVMHSVRDFADAAYRRVGLDWSRYVREVPSILARRRTGRVGNPAKLRRLTGWLPSLSFEGMVHAIVDAVAESDTQITDPQSHQATPLASNGQESLRQIR
jgi:GDPmannose 4,6-dehydratase